MSYISTAVGTERKSRVSGYNIQKGFFSNESSNLPQVIAIFAQGNTANQSKISTDKREITSAEEAGEIYGYGSPVHSIMRILRPTDSDGVGGIPTVVFAQLEEADYTATSFVYTVAGTATKATTHYLKINGRETLDYVSYSINLAKDDTAAVIAQKIADSINANLSSPVTATVVAAVVTIRTKWKGSSSKGFKFSISNNDDPAGVTYSKTSEVLGTGNVNVLDALNQFGSDHYTAVINSYGVELLDVLEQFNGTPQNMTGRYQPTVFKPFMAFFGSVESDKDSLAATTNANARIDQVTNVLCPAPNSEGFPYEAAANMVRLFARIMQDTPEIDVNGKAYPDMPTPSDGNIGDMSDYNNRDFLIKKGCSTVILNKSVYEVQDLVTTYHTVGENPLQFNYCRNLNLDWNISDAYNILEKNKLRDKVLVKDNQVTSSMVAIKPKEWKAILYDLFTDLAERALINEPEFSKASLRVEIPTDNPNRFNTFFRYKRTSIARIESTTAEAGF